MIYVGVDPGKKGGISVLRGDAGDDIVAYPWNDDKFIAYMRALTILRDKDGEKLIACVEKVGAYSGQGRGSIFTFGTEYGFIQGVLRAYGIAHQLVPPNVWKKEYSLIGKDKKASIETCQRLFPNLNLLPTERSRVPSDGLAESSLMAEYARRHF